MDAENAPSRNGAALVSRQEVCVLERQGIPPHTGSPAFLFCASNADCVNSERNDPVPGGGAGSAPARRIPRLARQKPTRCARPNLTASVTTPPACGIIGHSAESLRRRVRPWHPTQ